MCSVQHNPTPDDANYLWSDEFLLTRMVLRELDEVVEYRDQLKEELVRKLFEELDELKDEVKRYEEAEEAYIARLVQERDELEEEVRNYKEAEEKKQKEETTWRVEKIVEPKNFPPPYILKLPYPQ